VKVCIPLFDIDSIADVHGVAEELLEEFVEYWQGKFVMNIHSLLHLVDYARAHGPLWTMWAFQFEDKLQLLRDNRHATHQPERQMFEAVNILTSLSYVHHQLAQLPTLCETDQRVCAC
jgi:hypothetical protein